MQKTLYICKINANAKRERETSIDYNDSFKYPCNAFLWIEIVRHDVVLFKAAEKAAYLKNMYSTISHITNEMHVRCNLTTTTTTT